MDAEQGSRKSGVPAFPSSFPEGRREAVLRAQVERPQAANPSNAHGATIVVPWAEMEPDDGASLCWAQAWQLVNFSGARGSEYESTPGLPQSRYPLHGVQHGHVCACMRVQKRAHVTAWPWELSPATASLTGSTGVNNLVNEGFFTRSSVCVHSDPQDSEDRDSLFLPRLEV